MTFLENIVGTFNDGLWTYIVPWLLVGAGIFFGFRTALVQLRMIPSMFKSVVERPKGAGDDADEDYGGISAFQAFTISAASAWAPATSPVWLWPSLLVAQARSFGCGLSLSWVAQPHL